MAEQAREATTYAATAGAELIRAVRGRFERKRLQITALILYKYEHI
jgi:hypothetical protein